MFRLLLTWPSSGWIQLSEKLYIWCNTKSQLLETVQYRFRPPPLRPTLMIVLYYFVLHSIVRSDSCDVYCFIYIVSPTAVSSLMMAKSEVAETCSWCGYLSYTYNTVVLWQIYSIHKLLLYVQYTQRGWHTLKKSIYFEMLPNFTIFFFSLNDPYLKNFITVAVSIPIAK